MMRNTKKGMQADLREYAHQVNHVLRSHVVRMEALFNMVDLDIADPASVARWLAFSRGELDQILAVLDRYNHEIESLSDEVK